LEYGDPRTGIGLGGHKIMEQKSGKSIFLERKNSQTNCMKYTKQEEMNKLSAAHEAD
jgi:hypothetical protein